ncbi:argininosuccinate lyase [Xylographa soralifera]|nr:argininosuccinate lyase [Xylographa soralifera]
MAAQQQSSADGASGRLWGGRFTGKTDELMEQYNESLSFDRVFYAQDIAGSIAYARANVTTKILTQDEFSAIEKGLKQVLDEWRTDTFVVKKGIDEDIHTANERRLGEIIGTDIAGKLHTYAESTLPSN